MVSQTLARRLWPGRRAVGQRLVVDYSTAGTYPYEVVGVVNDVRFRGPRSTPLAEIYRDSALFQSLRDADRLEGKCGLCAYRTLCGGSRARAYAATGNPLASDPLCPYQPRELE